MHNRISIGLIALAVLLSMAPSGVVAFGDSKYPDFNGRWDRVGSPRWVTERQQPPLTPEYQAVYAANLADQAAGGPGDMASWYCLPQGMPMMMSL